MPESSATDPIVLPPKYYLDYFLDLLRFLEKYYSDVLGEPEMDFITQFDELSEDAKCLFLRFSNRKGPGFRVNKLDYEEIKDLSAATYELLENEFITEELPEDYATFNLFLKKELIEAYPELKPYKADPKPELIEHLLLQERSVNELARHEPVVIVEKQETFEFLKLLYFGEYKVPMSEFVVRDVGHVKLERLDENSFSPWCQTRDEAAAFFEISQIKSTIRKALKLFPASAVHPEIESIPWVQFQRYSQSEKALSKIALELGQQLEREKEPELALLYYRLSTKPPSRERQVRILDTLGHKEEATGLAQKMFEEYDNATERIFAKDFLNRPNVRINRSMTTRLRDAPSLSLSPEQGLRVEHLVIQHFQGNGYEAVHAENYLWRNLFGLLYWEELFDQSQDGFHHPLQRASADLYQPDFFKKRAPAFEAKAKTLNTRKKILAKVEHTHEEKFGLASPMVYWHEQMLTYIRPLVEKLQPRQIKGITWEMARNMKENATGFPDLFIWNEQEYFFYEIKSPNDHLSAQQLFWLEQMQHLKINADILRVNYDAS